MKVILVVFAAVFLSTSHCVSEAAEQIELDQYNVVWTSQSKDSSESMPVGGHDIGLNVWVEKGELLFYVQRSGCFDENNEYLKLGRIRLRVSPDPFAAGADFRQELKLRRGYAEIVGRKDSLDVKVRVWVEAHRPIVHIDIQSNQLVSAEVAYEGWRNDDVELPNDGKNSRFGCFSLDQYPGKVIRYRDVVGHRGDSVLFYHRNQDDKLLFDFMTKQQGLESVKEEMVNTQKGRTFGGLLCGDGFVAAGTTDGKYVLTPYKAWRIRSEKSATSHKIKLFTHVGQIETLAEWTNGLNKLAGSPSPTDEQAFRQTLGWWDEFWRRSWLVIKPETADPADRAWQVGRNYQLFRYQLGCNAYGDYPTKFNGGNFTYDPSLVLERRKHTPDWRAWGGGSFTAQNQRLVYWPMLKTGDFDMMKPQFEFYRRALPNATARVRTYWGHEGCLFTEQMENFGLPIACAWGWTEPAAKGRRRPANIEHGVQVNGAVNYHYEAQLEFSYMIMEYHRFTGADISQYMDFIKQSVKFFDEHYQMRCRKRTGKSLDENGKLVIYPSTSCESYGDAKNPSDLIAGLRSCTESVLDLSEEYITQSERSYYKEFLGRIPDYGYGQVEGDRIIKPAWSWSRYQNCECPQFYPLFPFNRFALGKDDMTLFKNTWKHGKFAKNIIKSWHQDGIFFARMGLTKDAADYNTKKMQDSGRRFPSFWGPGHDWVPDHNWGGCGMIGVQEMLIQTIGKEIRLLPAWPKEWDVDFKLCAPYQTSVEGKVRSGKIVTLKVNPQSRRKDVVIMTTR